MGARGRRIVLRRGQRRASKGAGGLLRLQHGLPERIERGFGLPHQHVRRITQWVTSLRQGPRRLARNPRSAPDFLGEHRAGVEMRADGVGQVRPTLRAQERAPAEHVRAELDHAEASGAADTPDRVVPTVGEEARAPRGSEPEVAGNRDGTGDHSQRRRCRPARSSESTAGTSARPVSPLLFGDVRIA